MSQQAIADFIAKVESDEALKNRLSQLEGNWVPGTMEVAREMGYEFTQDELKAYIEENYSDNLSDEMLDKVAGGTSNSNSDWG